MSAEWNFARHISGQVVVNPLGSEHFAESDDDWRPGEVLVRECIQNSIDARHENHEVVVHFQVHEAGEMSTATASHWFAGLWPHLGSKDCRLSEIEGAPSSGGFVVVEDFGTRGLEGDVRQGGLSDSDNRFFNFFRAEGLSGNPMNGTTGGSWGVGKSVFNRCSRINTFLALTARRTERDLALVGKSLLWHHRLGPDEYQGLGQFGTKDPANEFLVLPETSDVVLQRFQEDFKLTRNTADPVPEPGLSVVIPYSDPAITAEGILEIVIREYFHPIIAGSLRVQVTGTIKGKPDSVEISRANVLQMAGVLGRADFARVLDLAAWAHGDGPSNAYELAEPPEGRAPAWNDELLRPMEPAFADLCSRFNRGDPVSIRVPLRVNAKGQSPDRASFIVYFQRDQVGTGYRPVFVRGSIVVPNARQRSLRNHSVFSLVTIDDKPLATMLRAAEPPAHTYWSPDTANFKGRYSFGKQTIDFVVGAPKYLADALSNSRTERDFDVWADYFPLPASDGDRESDGTKRKGKRRSADPPKPPIPRPKPFKIDEVVGGFIVDRDNAATTAVPGLLEVVVAYDISRGNPFARYDPADFEFPALTRVWSNADEVKCDKNLLVFRPTADAFKVTVTGLDPHRDVVVKVRTIDGATGGAE
jgi:hypothetical protein